VTSADLLYYAAADALAQGDVEAVLDACESGLRLDPSHAGLHELCGIAYLEHENDSAAVHHFETASSIRPLLPAAALALANCYIRFGLTDSASTILQFLAEPGRCPVPLMPDLARALGLMGSYRSALDICEQLTQLRPTYHPAHFGVAFYRRRLGYPLEKSLAPLQAAVRLEPDAVFYRLNLAALLADLGRTAEAVPWVQGIDPASISHKCLRRRLAMVFALAAQQSPHGE
jgi:tetratricopeptide (TPR) repeat protein